MFKTTKSEINLFFEFIRPFVWPPRAKGIYSTLKGFSFHAFREVFCVFNPSGYQNFKTSFNPCFTDLCTRFRSYQSQKEAFNVSNSKAYPIATNRHVWLECTMVKDRFWKMGNENQTVARISFEQSSNSSGESTTSDTWFPSWITRKVNVSLNPRLITRMRLERAEVAWTELRFEGKSQSSIIFMDWIFRLLIIPINNI